MLMKTVTKQHQIHADEMYSMSKTLSDFAEYFLLDHFSRVVSEIRVNFLGTDLAGGVDFQEPSPG